MQRHYPPAAVLLLISATLTGGWLLLAGLLMPDQPLAPIRTQPDQTPVTWAPRPTATAVRLRSFEPYGTPAVRWPDRRGTMLDPCINQLLIGPCVTPSAIPLPMR